VFEKEFKTLKAIKLTGGIFGKTTLLLIVLCVCVAAVCFRAGVWWLSLILMLPLMGIVTCAFMRCMDFAEKNPQAAIMDGAEFLGYEQMVQGRKGEEALPSYPQTTDHQSPQLLPQDLEATDPPPLPSVPSGNAHSEEGGV
jgi:hypothetical protein